MKTQNRMWLLPLLSVVLAACPDKTSTFGVATSSPNISLLQGSSGDVPILVQTTNGFKSLVALGLSGAPTEVTGSFSPLNVDPGSSSVLTLSASSSATPGTTTLTITGVGGGLTATTSIVLTITAPAVGSKPTILSFTAAPGSLPAGGGSTTLSWSVVGATKITVDGGVGDVTGQSSKAVTVAATKSFTLTAENANGSVTATADVTVGVTNVQGGIWDSSKWNEANWQ